jgi:hypothetical protein
MTHDPLVFGRFVRIIRQRGRMEAISASLPLAFGVKETGTFPNALRLMSPAKANRKKRPSPACAKHLNFTSSHRKRHGRQELRRAGL